MHLKRLRKIFQNYYRKKELKLISYPQLRGNQVQRVETSLTQLKGGIFMTGYPSETIPVPG